MTFSILGIGKRFSGRISITMLLVLAESLIDLMFPLFLGWAVNDLIKQDHTGLLMLAGLGLLSLVIGSARRFYDTRIYSGIYQEISTDIVAIGRNSKLPVSTVSARADLLTELVAFFEQDMPGIVMSIIGVVGILLVIATMNMDIFYGCLMLAVLIAITYTATGSKQYKMHAGFNHTKEQQIKILSDASITSVKNHFRRLMRWNIKLSDMETFNFAVIWLGAVALFVSAPLLAVNAAGEDIQVGTILSLLIYVFEYCDKVILLPFFIQQLIRLQEISHRLQST